MHKQAAFTRFHNDVNQCLPVFLSAGQLKKLSTNFYEISGGAGCVTSDKKMGFGGHLDLDVDPEIFEGIFLPLRDRGN